MIVNLPDGFLSGPSRSDHLIDIPERMGSLRVSKAGTVGPKRFTVSGIIRAETAAAAKILWDKALQHLNQEDLEIRFAEWPEMVGHARLENGPPWNNVTGMTHAGGFNLAFVMANPLKYALVPDVYVLPDSAPQTPLVLGSASSDVEIILIGTGQPDPALFYRDAQGLVRGQILFDFPAPTGLPTGWWIEMDHWGISYVHGAFVLPLTELAPENVSDALKSTTRLFTADPNDGDGVQGPTVQAVNCNAQVKLRRAWL
jgi:hypothetical protein